MGRTRKLVLSLACCVCLAAPAIADEAVPLSAGTRVRVTAPELLSRRVTGTLAAAGEREIVLALSSTERRTIPRSTVTRLEWSRGRHGHALAGAAVGALLGGAFAAVASGLACDVEICEGSPASAFLVCAGLGALPGAGIGALVRTERWVDAPGGRVRVSVAPTHGRGVAASLSLQF
jgi:hypothetical protein